LGVLGCAAIAEVTGVACLAFGRFDLAADLGIDPDGTSPALAMARASVVLASTAERLGLPLDSPWLKITDLSGLRAAAERARADCAKFPESYWRQVDSEKRYPDDFVRALTDGGWLLVLIPTEYGGAGLGLVEACLVLEEINASGGNAAVCHAQMYTMGALLRY